MQLQTLSDFNAMMNAIQYNWWLLNELMSAQAQLQVSNDSSNDSWFGNIKSPVCNIIIVNFTW